MRELSSDKPICVLIVDDHTILRQGLRLLLSADPNIEVVGEAGTGRDAVALAQTLNPDVIVMDISLPDMTGIAATSAILTDNPTINVLVLSMSDDETFVRGALRAGVRGYLVKESAANELLSAIREVARGNAFFSPTVSRTFLQSPKAKADSSVVEGDNLILTERECQILKLIAKGLTSREIGERLSISSKTVDKHRQQIMDRLDIHDAVRLTRYAIEKKIV